MSSTCFYFPGTVGLLAAALFVITELFLLPLFEQTRERLTATYLRHRISNGNSVWLGCENKLSQWLGISDGVYMAGRGLILPRFLKTLLKITLLVSCFIFDFNIEPVKVATKATYHFNGDGAYVVAPIPIAGLKNSYGVSNEELEKFDNETSYDGLGIDFPSWCTSMNRSQSSIERIVYFGVFNAPDNSLVCLNGTDGRDRGIAFSYNPDTTMTNDSQISSLRLMANGVHVGRCSLCYAEIIIKGSSDVHRGYVGIWDRSIFPKQWRIYGLFVHSKRKTILRLLIKLYVAEELLCNQMFNRYSDNDNWVGNWTRSEGALECPNRSYSHGTKKRIDGDIQDISFRLGSSDQFVLDTPLDVLRLWVFNDFLRAAVVENTFATQVQNTISSSKFYFSGAKSDTIELQTGPTVDHSRIARFPAIALCVSVAALFLYCVVSFLVDFCSRIVTGIPSNILSRDACIRMLQDEIVTRDLIHESQKFRLPVTVKTNSSFRIRLAIDRQIMTKNVVVDSPS